MSEPPIELDDRADISSRIVLAMRDYAAMQIGAEVAGEVFEGACEATGVAVENAGDPRGWVSIAMFHALAEGLAPLVRGDVIADAVAWIIPAKRELSSMSLTAIARPGFFYRQLDRARGFYAKHVSFEVEMTGASSATVDLRHRDGLERRRETCAVARGVLTAVPLLFHEPAAKVRETACYAEGDPCCRFEVEWRATRRLALVGFAVGALIAAAGAVAFPSLAWLAAPAIGWTIGQVVLAISRRRHMMTVIEEQRTALGAAEADLERRFHEVLELKDTLETVEKAQSEILDAGVQALLGELVGEFAHEMRNPMSAVLFNLSFLEEAKEKDSADAIRSDEIGEIDDVLSDIRYGIERMRGVLSWFVDVFRAGGQEPGLICLNTEVERAVDLLRREWVGRIEVHCNCGDAPMIRSFGKEVVQVLINLLVNAAHATKRGNIWVETKVSEGHVVLTIRDDGNGMPKEVLERAFERGFTTKSSGPDRGRGLGLFICRRITERNGGQIELSSEKGVGTEAVVRFPTVDSPDAPHRRGPLDAYAP